MDFLAGWQRNHTNHTAHEPNQIWLGLCAVWCVRFLGRARGCFKLMGLLVCGLLGGWMGGLLCALALQFGGFFTELASGLAVWRGGLRAVWCVWAGWLVGWFVGLVAGWLVDGAGRPWASGWGGRRLGWCTPTEAC